MKFLSSKSFVKVFFLVVMLYIMFINLNIFANDTDSKDQSINIKTVEAYNINKSP